MTQTRANNYDGLIKFFAAHTYDPPGPGMPRYAAVSEEFFDDQRVGAKIGLYETEQDAFEFLGESVLEGYTTPRTVSTTWTPPRSSTSRCRPQS